mgnify:CR=1 FL=1
MGIDTQGSAIGKCNVLTVLEVGDSVFGMPARISATVYPGGSGIVDIEREVSLAVARTPEGQVAFGPLVENVHRDGILRTSVYPANVPDGTEEKAREMARNVAEHWGLEGLMTLEFFQLPGGELLVNEVAPRVHNSGHLTQDGGGISQFEAQVRARSGLALKHGIICPNAPGTVDSDYRGEVGVILANIGSEPFVIRRGERIAQLVIARHERAEWVEVEALDQTARGSSGFGSTGR